MRRRNFLQYTSGAAAVAALPSFRAFDAEIARALTPIPTADRKALADAALNAAKSAGATYADARLNRYLSQSMSARDGRISSVSNSESYGCGVRVIASGTWGFAATNDLTPEGVARAAREAVAIAKANARLQTEPVQLAPVPGYGEVSWKTPIETNPFDVPLSDKADLLTAASAAALGAGARFVNASLRFVNEQRYFASTEGTYAEQERTKRLFEIVMVAIASISLLVGGIGIMNIMLASVMERTREIGVRRAIGATRRAIVRQFLVETTLITVTGGALGTIVGILLSQLVAYFAGWSTIVTVTSVAVASIVSVTIGIVFGLYPALRAARLDPVSALHYE